MVTVMTAGIGTVHDLTVVCTDTGQFEWLLASTYCTAAMLQLLAKQCSTKGSGGIANPAHGTWQIQKQTRGMLSLSDCGARHKVVTLLGRQSR